MSFYTVVCEKCGTKWKQGVIGRQLIGMHNCPNCGSGRFKPATQEDNTK